MCIILKVEKEEYEEHIITMKQNKIDLTSDSPFEVILKFAIPVIGGSEATSIVVSGVFIAAECSSLYVDWLA